MRREYVTYSSDLPIKISYASIKEYPLHWHNSIEILYVLKGKIKLTIDADNFEIYENEMEIINVEETHRLFSDEDNKVLIFQIDPIFFEKYYKDIKNMFFYTNTLEEGAQEGEEYDELRIFLAKLLCEAVQRQENYDEEIEGILIDLLFHLINNFHYLMYEQEQLKKNKEQLDRYHRISKYIFNNYNNNITLQEIAKKEFLSPHYLSHEIKYATGSSFTDLLNLTRVEESIKLLLDTEMSISEISDTVGFSHTRYFNKHFKIYYKSTPLQYRRKNKVDLKTFEKLKNIEFLPIEDSLDLLVSYLDDYERFNNENKLWNVHINMNDSVGSYKEHYRQIINLGDAFDLMIEDNKDILEEIQDEIHFEYGRLENFFSNDMGVFKSSDFFNWNRALTVLDFLSYISLNPLILLDNISFDLVDYIKALDSFILYFNEIDTDISLIKFQLSATLDSQVKLGLKDYINDKLNFEILADEFIQQRSLNTTYDSSYMLPYIIHNHISSNKDLNFLRAFDVLERETYLTNEVFIGSSGLVNDMGIKKPSYYAYFLLSKLSGEIVAQDNGYIVTKYKNSYSILLYTYNELIENELDYKTLLQKRAISKANEQKISLNLINVNSTTRITTYEINEKVGSSYNYWISMGKPDRLSKEEKQILHKASFPKIDFKYAKKSSVLNIITKLKGYAATLIMITPTGELKK